MKNSKAKKQNVGFTVLIVAIAVIILAGIALTIRSCVKAEKETTVPVTSADIIGTWEFESMDLEFTQYANDYSRANFLVEAESMFGEGYTFSEYIDMYCEDAGKDQAGQTYTFNEDGTGVCKLKKSSTEFTWGMYSDYVFARIDDTDYQFELKDGKLVMTNDYYEMIIYMTYVKQAQQSEEAVTTAQ